MKKLSINKILIVLSFVLFAACTNSNKSFETDDKMLVMVNDDPVSNKFESTFSSPSPEELMMLFESTDISFNAKAVNDPDKVSTYITSKSLANNLGVYVTDAAYLNLHKQYAIMTGYLESIFKITDKLNLAGVYMEFDFKKVFKEMDHPDSLIILSEGIYHAVTNYMTENNNEQLLCMISQGSVVELLYLAMQSIPEFNAEDPLLQHIYDQQMQLSNLMEFAQQFAGNADIDEMITDLSSILAVMETVEHEKSETVLSKTEGGELSIAGGNKHKFDEEQYNNLKATVTEIRQKITN